MKLPRLFTGLLCAALVARAAAAPLAPLIAPERGAASAEPARHWERGFLAGNGVMGAVYLGEPGDESVILNHALLFLPLGAKEIVPELAPHLPELRAIFARDGARAAIRFAMEKGVPLGHQGLVFTDPFHPGYTLKIAAPDSARPVAGSYLRTEDFTTGEIAARWRAETGEHDRRVFVSRAQNVAVVRLRASAGVTATLSIPPIPDSRVRAYTLSHGIPADSPEAAANVLIKQTLKTSAQGYALHNLYTRGKGGYDGALRLVVRGGSVTADPAASSVSIRDADEVLILSRLEPFSDPAASAPDRLRAELDALPADYDVLLARHAAVHGELFARVAVDFGATPEERRQTTDALLARATSENTLSPALLEKIYDGSRHVIISSSGIRPPNLQGIWTGTWQPAWSGDYTLDTNVQLAIAHALSSGTPELLDGYFDLIETSLPDWRLNAKNLYGARGVMAPIRQSNNGKSLHWSDRFVGGLFWTAGAGWLGHWFYDYYLYTGDRAFLENRAMPYLREVAAFYEDFAIADAGGALRLTPSYSPENGTFDNSVMDLAVARQVFTHLIAGARILVTDTNSIPRWETFLARLPSYPVSDAGVLLEWADPKAATNDHHRHMAHLYPLHHGHEFDPETTPALWDAADRAYEARRDAWFRHPDSVHAKNKNETASHGRMHLALAAARLGRGKEVWEILARMAAAGSIYPSMATAHYEQGRVFNMDANGAMPEVINQCLAFSLPGRIDLLPALPAVMRTGEVRGLHLRGGVVIERMRWDEHTVAVTLRSAAAQTVALRLGDLRRPLALPAGEPVSLSLARANPARAGQSR